MPEEFFERLAVDKCLRGNPLVPHLSSFAASLQEDGYATFTMQSKLGLLADFAQWLGAEASRSKGLMSVGSRHSSIADSEDIESIEVIEKRSGSFWGISASVMLFPAPPGRFAKTPAWPTF